MNLCKPNSTYLSNDWFEQALFFIQKVLRSLDTHRRTTIQPGLLDKGSLVWGRLTNLSLPGSMERHTIGNRKYTLHLITPDLAFLLGSTLETPKPIDLTDISTQNGLSSALSHLPKQIKLVLQHRICMLLLGFSSINPSSRQHASQSSCYAVERVPFGM